ncbi:diguanylate cyclase [Thalassotalea sp. HSM 43]|uniref:sigma 54-interacting transcriptional regulator n=1 Tax=Thalassotalea sp. HSM 43 TaxID=2552945 RepID=UPI0010805819|nr:sigma 54-interacting transcriptional regulator [Thalassotalea sp. HSM 43]QBY05771.1 diguanylate cyclase [Thalassotalea sp. HSM 43]
MTIDCQQQLLQQAVSAIGEVQVYLDSRGQIVTANQSALSLLAPVGVDIIGQPWPTLIRMREDLSSRHAEQFIDAAIKVDTLTKLQPIAVQCANNASVLLDGIIAPMHYDDMERGAVLFLRQLTRLDHLPMGLANHIGDENKSVSGILLLSPDNFNQVNIEYGREIGDKVLYGIGDFLRKFARPGDLASHYGGTIYMLMFYDTNEEQMLNMSSRLQTLLHEHRFAGLNQSLSFSCGLALNSQEVSYSPIELFYYANFSLSNALETGGNQLNQWQHQNTLTQIGNLDKISGKVSQTTDGDYQKMLMQWSIINQQGDNARKEEFIESTLAHLCHGFELDQSGYYEIVDSGNGVTSKLLCAIDQQGQPVEHAGLTISDTQLQFLASVENASSDYRVFTSVLANSGTQSIVGVYDEERLLGCLSLINHSGMSIQKRDHHVLCHIADFIAMTLTKLGHSDTAVVSQNKNHVPNFWFNSMSMHKLMDELQLVAPTNATVLITGESGTGKEMLAKSLHHFSDRKDQPFVIFDCGTVVENLVESELFGHVKGAFTGASKASTGAIAKADGGTLFLDEIGELPLEMQVKLLRFVQEKQYSQVGSSDIKRVDVRLVAATNVDLKERIKQGLFREDLYYRLDVFNLKNIPLRQRSDDILLIASSYLQVYNREYNKGITGFTADAKQALLDYPWPGNIRELKNLIHRAVILCSEQQLGCAHLGLYHSGENVIDTEPEHTQSSVQRENTHFTNNQADIAGVALPSVSYMSASNSNAMHGEAAQSNVAYAPATAHNLAAHSPVPHSPAPLNTPSASHSAVSSYSPNTVAFMFDQGVEQALTELVFAISDVTLPYQKLPPVASYLEYALYQYAMNQCQQVVLQSANVLLLPEATFRRRWQKLQQLPEVQDYKLLGLINHISESLMRMPLAEPRVDLMQRLLAKAALDSGLAANRACQLLAMSAPTFRKLKHRLAA